MSLKIIHIVFIIAAAALAGLLAAWSGVRYGASDDVSLLALGAGSVVALIGLTAYLRAFIGRCRREGWT